MTALWWVWKYTDTEYEKLQPNQEVVSYLLTASSSSALVWYEGSAEALIAFNSFSSVLLNIKRL